MFAERWREIERLYHSASERTPEERQVYLASATDDEALRREVESLLANEESAADFLETHNPELAEREQEESIPPSRQIGPYLIIEFLRAGGMGEVYKALDTRLERPVAIKFLPSSFGADYAALDRFHREARAASATNHPRICTLYDVGDYEGRPFLVMEFLEGTSLKDWIAGKPVPIADILETATQIAEGLRAAHAKDIVHRDIKPANIFLTPGKQIKILDFGLAKFGVESNAAKSPTRLANETVTAATRPGSVMGTLAYLSPEQARGEEIDVRTDIYSLGVVLYQMATGRLPFQGNASRELIAAILHETPVKPSALNPSVPNRLEQVILKAMERDREKRYQSAEEMLADLHSLQPGKSRLLQATPLLVLVSLALASVTGIVIFRRTNATAGVPDVIQRQLTANPVNDSVYSSAISPDGKQLAYSDLEGVHIRTIDTGKVHSIPVQDGLCFKCPLSWFPDGTKLLINGPAGNHGGLGVWILDTTDGELRKIHDGGFGAVLSPDGSQIAFITRPDPLPGVYPNREIWVMGPNGENPTRMMATAPGQGVWLLNWSPDGRWLAYRRNIGQTDNVLEALALGATSARQVFENPDLLDFTWLSPSVLVLNLLEGPDQLTSNLWEIHVDPNTMQAIDRPRRLTNWAGFLIGTMSATKDGRRLAITKQLDHSDVLVGELPDDGGTLRHIRRLTSDQRADWPGGWSPDGRWLLFQSDRTGHMGIYRQLVDSTDPEPLVVDQSDNRWPIVSPDGKWVLYLSWPGRAGQDKTGRLMRIPAGGGSVEPILETKGALSFGIYGHVQIPTTEGQTAFRCPSRPGAPCVLAEVIEHEISFSSFDPVPSAAKTEIFRIKVNTPGNLFWDLSPDGSRISFGELPHPLIRVREIKSGTTTDISLPTWLFLYTIGWAADGKSLFATDLKSTETSILRITLDGKISVLYKAAKQVELPKASPDGRQLAFGEVISASNVWLIDGIPK